MRTALRIAGDTASPQHDHDSLPVENVARAIPRRDRGVVPLAIFAHGAFVQALTFEEQPLQSKLDRLTTDLTLRGTHLMNLL